MPDKEGRFFVHFNFSSPEFWTSHTEYNLVLRISGGLFITRDLSDSALMDPRYHYPRFLVDQ